MTISATEVVGTDSKSSPSDKYLQENNVGIVVVSTYGDLEQETYRRPGDVAWA